MMYNFRNSYLLVHVQCIIVNVNAHVQCIWILHYFVHWVKLDVY